jgi:hypothetical protein
VRQPSVAGLLWQDADDDRRAAHDARRSFGYLEALMVAVIGRTHNRADLDFGLVGTRGSNPEPTD